MKPADLDLRSIWSRAHNLPNHAYTPRRSKVWRIIGLILFGCIVYAIAFLHGSFNQAMYETERWQQVREQLLTPPKGQRPPERTIQELGIRVTWLEWDKYRPDKHIAVEDVR